MQSINSYHQHSSSHNSNNSNNNKTLSTNSPISITQPTSCTRCTTSTPPGPTPTAITTAMEVMTFINSNNNSNNIMNLKWTEDLAYNSKWAPASIKSTQVPILPARAVIIVSLHIRRSLRPPHRPLRPRLPLLLHQLLPRLHHYHQPILRQLLQHLQRPHL